MKKETLVSIAERSGCSISTVSRVLSGNAAKYRISQRTVARVTEEVKRCNYTPSLLAKGLRTNRTDTIGLLIPNIENSFFAGVAGVVIRESRNYNYKVVVVDTQEDERNEQDGLSALLARRVDGIVAAPCGSNSEQFASVQEGGKPLVLNDIWLKRGNTGYYTEATCPDHGPWFLRFKLNRRDGLHWNFARCIETVRPESYARYKKLEKSQRERIRMKAERAGKKTQE